MVNTQEETLYERLNNVLYTLDAMDKIANLIERDIADKKTYKALGESFHELRSSLSFQTSIIGST